MKSLQIKPHGPLGAKIAIVFDHPGKDDLTAGQALIGWQGKLLNEMLSAAGIYRSIFETYTSGVGYQYQVTSSVYVTFLSPHAPWAGDFETTFYSDPKRGTPNQDFSDAASALALDPVLQSCNVIVACGEHSFRALTGKRSISKWRGSILESTLIAGRKVVPILDPNRVQKDYSNKVLCIHDFKRVKRQSAFPEIRRPVTNFLIGPSLEQVVETCKLYEQSSKLAVDIETRGNHISCVGFAPNATDALCVPFTRGKGNYWETPREEAEAWRAIARLLGNENVRKIGQNFQYDCSYLLWHGCPVRGIWWDTMLAQNILYPELEKSLAVLGSIYTEFPYYKDEGRAALGLKSEKSWSTRQFDEQLWIYNSTDCVVTYGVQEGQQLDFEELREREAA